jgi:hypothetical protein
MQKQIRVAVGAEPTLVLTSTPGGAIQVFFKAAAAAAYVLWTETTDYTIAGDTVTFVAPLAVDDAVQVYWTS